jgi:uncharacterized protein (TIGR03790 family)
VAALLRSLQAQAEKNPKSPPELARALEFRRGELAGLRAGVNSLSGLSESVERDTQLLWLLQQSDGALGAMVWIDQQRELWQKNETYASFDSELALVSWPGYALLRWQNNPLHYAFDSVPRDVLPQTFLVARLEAPTVEKAKALVDAALATEQSGLTGRFYIDARGMAAEKAPGSYGDFDQSLRDLAAFVREQTSIEVVLDNASKLFQEGECPDAALYCGWYSLATYIDAFDWKPGAVAWHIASGEAATLRDANSNVWCKRLLEDGVAATLGPVHEPYLPAFPRPLDFFALLLSGRYTLGEVYARTVPYQSWTMTLVGDPLYNPFKGRPAFDIDNPPANVRRALGRPRGTPASAEPPGEE